ncbi:MAG TPA: SH3 domain-containing protein [Anaerolineales bacterium]|nr:SH3 domain-containing protein [Anaerolineales bacterium]
MKYVSTPGYHLYKLIVAVTLVVILVLMVVRGCATIAAAPAPTTIETTLAVEVTQTLTPSPVPTASELTTTPATASPTITLAATEPPTITPEQATPTTAQSVSCNTTMPSRLNVGQMARLLRTLSMRSDASIDAPLVQTNLANTQVEIIGGPVCTPVGDGAYLWWQIRLPSGTEGWSVESSLNEASYFLEPVS